MFQKVADYEPDQPEAFRRLGTCYFQMGRFADAAKAGREAEAAEDFQP